LSHYCNWLRKCGIDACKFAVLFYHREVSLLFSASDSQATYRIRASA
jgi:hypothetical protein